MTSALLAIKSKGLGGLAGETAENVRTAGNTLVNAVKGTPKPVTPAVGEVVDLGAKPALTPAQVGITTADDVSRGMAEGLSVAKPAFGSVAEAGSISKFMLNRVGGITSTVGLEVGGKALGGLGAGISAEGDISNLIEPGHILKPNESGMSEAGNITSMIGGALDMASIAVPVLAPLALGLNIFSAVTSTIGAVEDDKNQVSTDSKPPQENTLSNYLHSISSKLNAGGQLSQFEYGAIKSSLLSAGQHNVQTAPMTATESYEAFLDQFII